MKRSPSLATKISLLLVFAAPTRAQDELGVLAERMRRALLRGRTDERALTALVEKQRADGGWDAVDYASQRRSAWPTAQHLSQLEEMARGFVDPRCKLAGNRRLERAVFAALEHWLANDYRNPNWWWNQIGVPRTLANTMLLLDPVLSQEQRGRGIEILKRARIRMTGQNRMWVSAITARRGVLARDPELVRKAFAAIAGVITASGEEGLQADRSFHQHGPCLYCFGYGRGFLFDGVENAALVRGTSFAFPKEKIDLLASYLLDGQRWMLRGNHYDYGGGGREITRKHLSARGFAGACTQLAELETGREPELLALREHLEGRRPCAVEGNRHFWRSDFMAHQRAGWYASARMFSTRTLNTDQPCNREGLLSHHLADGCNYLMRRGDEYADIFPVWDWCKIPGTTAVQRERPEGKVCVRGKTDFAGGVSDGRCGMAAFALEREELHARKFWFFCDEAYLCLGAGIQHPGPEPVATAVQQSHLRGKVARSTEKGWRLVHHDGNGYLFPKATELGLHAGTQTGSWRAINERYTDEPVKLPVFSLWIEHGSAPKNASYQYVVAPDVEVEGLKRYAASMPFEVLANRPELQAARHRGDDLTAVAFHASGPCEIAGEASIETDAPCLLLWRSLDSNVEVSVSDPTCKLERLRITWRSSALGEGSRLVELPRGERAGSTVGFEIQSTAPAAQEDDEEKGAPLSLSR